MKLVDAIIELDRLDREHGRYVFTKHDLRVIFPEENDTSLNRSIERLVNSNILTRPVRGVFVYERAVNKGGYLIEEVAKAMRQFEVCYVSLESALSEYGLISQIPVSRITVVTTGRSGEYETPYGVIEFTHSKRGWRDLHDRFLYEAGRPMPIAKPEFALADLLRVGRNVNMIDKRAAKEMNVKVNL